MSHKGNDMYYERMKEQADEMMHEKYKALKTTAYDEKTYTRSNRKYLIREIKADIKRIKAMYKSIGVL